MADQVRAQYRHFVVDEYQDVNPAQQRLLHAWLGDRDDLTVVGDASQTIYSFTGATSSYLVSFARDCRPGRGTLVRLVRDYRSTPQVVSLANQIIRLARGDEAKLRLELVGQRPAGPEPVLRGYADEPAEAAGVAARCAELIAGGTAPQEIAVLFRTNAQSEAYEAAHGRGRASRTSSRARSGSSNGPRCARRWWRSGRRPGPSPPPSLRAAVVEALEAVGWRPGEPPPGGAARERWEALAALVGLAEEFGDNQALPRVRRGAGPSLRRSARADYGRGHPGQPPRGEGTRVGRRLPGRAGRRRAAHGVRQNRRRDRGGAAPALRRDHPRAAVADPLVCRSPVTWGAATAPVALPAAGRSGVGPAVGMPASSTVPGDA